MHNKFKDGSKVLVCGPGQKDGKYYNRKLAKVLYRDPHFKDYYVKFYDNSEDWILPKYLQKPNAKKKGIK